ARRQIPVSSSRVAGQSTRGREHVELVSVAPATRNTLHPQVCVQGASAPARGPARFAESPLTLVGPGTTLRRNRPTFRRIFPAASRFRYACRDRPLCTYQRW